MSIKEELRGSWQVISCFSALSTYQLRCTTVPKGERTAASASTQTPNTSVCGAESRTSVCSRSSAAPTRTRICRTSSAPTLRSQTWVLPTSCHHLMLNFKMETQKRILVMSGEKILTFADWIISQNRWFLVKFSVLSWCWQKIWDSPCEHAAMFPGHV